MCFRRPPASPREVPIGQWYCVLENHPDHGVALLLLDPVEIRKQRLDAYEANKTKGGLRIPLTSGKAEFAAQLLSIELTVDRSKRDRGSLRIHFGPHLLNADLVMHPHR